MATATATPATARRAAWLAAKAKAEDIQPEIMAITADTYLVLGASDDYQVSRCGLSFTCDCKAGQHGRPCYHVARAALLPHEAYRRAALRAILSEARALTAKPVSPCAGYLREHPATGDRIASFWCDACAPDDCR